MPVTAIVGAQYGSEGKGKIAAYLAFEFDASIRTGGPNAGHSYEFRSMQYRLQMVPCALINPNCILAMGAGAIIDAEILFREMEQYGVARERLLIDYQAGVIQQRHREEEVALQHRIGSTGKGVGAAVAAKSMRREDFQIARDISSFEPHLNDVAGYVNTLLANNARVCLEGTQGFGLSLHHGSYPHVTSRDTTAGTLCGDAGISPLHVDDVILVVRSFPIRSGGNTGPFKDELEWSQVADISGDVSLVPERTTVTNRQRRVAAFDLEMVKRAALLNGATQIALTFADYLDFSDRGKRSFDRLSRTSREFIDDLEVSLNRPVSIVGTGPGEFDLIDRRESFDGCRELHRPNS